MDVITQLETMLRIYMRQNPYDLSDIGAKYEVIDSRTFSELCGVESGRYYWPVSRLDCGAWPSRARL
jgi:hypothetical protein